MRTSPVRDCHCEPVPLEIVIANQSADWCGNPPVLPRTTGQREPAPLEIVIANQSADWCGNPPVLPRTTERTTPMNYYVYILTNAHKNLIYVGVTNDLIRRVYEHKHHLDADSYTAKYNIDQLVYFETTSDVYSAISREKQLKGWNRARKNKLVEMKNPGWADIYESLLG